MKIRKGFVSNSSSSSFILCLPKDFDVKTFVKENPKKIENLNRWDGNYVEETIIEKLNTFVVDGGAWEGDDYELFNIVSELMSDFQIASVEAGPDCGSIDLIEGENLVEQLKKLGHI